MAARIQSSAIDIKIERLVKADAGPVSAFTCGCDELDYFFHNEMFECVNNHYLSAYCAKSMNNDLLAIFTLVNDSIVLTDYEAKDDFILEAGCRINDTYLDIFNQQSMFPAVNIGHLGVLKHMQNKGIGSQILEFVIDTFKEFNVAGCQFITVDALNTPQVKKFYAGRYFIRLTSSDEGQPTVRMYFTLGVLP